ncbi:hypothetical protein AMTR_s00033p00146160 [Amborella trichopoda]|uniref:Uncharacterized protein n=1 Tax=Amborella trichopoda TaxID=13333 RepID=U5CWB9_AMBTC|nr:hypothetical protein AMTR_s00033p00146160 [Amborella trichopoda]
MFVVRVLTGYEERRLRAYNMQLRKRLQLAQERKEALRRMPEQSILTEVRRMVEEMQNVNRKLDETEAAIEEYFKPIDKQADLLMNKQLEGEERNMKEMVKIMQERVLQEAAEAERRANAEMTEEATIIDVKQQIKETESKPTAAIRASDIVGKHQLPKASKPRGTGHVSMDLERMRRTFGIFVLWNEIHLNGSGCGDGPVTIIVSNL